MADLSKGLVQPFLGALQACISVLLTLLYGVITRHVSLINDETIDQMSGICVKIFLPALILVKLGSELSLDIALHYVPVLVWSILYTLLSICIGHVLSRCLRLPTWVTPAIAFNNTSSLPLLLLQTLQSTGSLKLITMPGQSESGCMNRAQSYFLVCAVVSKSIAYAVAPRMLSHADSNGRKGDDRETRHDRDEGLNVSVQPQNQFRHDITNTSEDQQGEEEEEEEVNEQTSLLPRPIRTVRHNFFLKTHHLFSYLPRPVRRRIDALDSPFLDTAILCAATGVLLGLVPKLHRAFFSPYEEGGIFNAWLISSIKNVGTLFTSLQVFLLGCKLGASFERIKRSPSHSPSESSLEENDDEEESHTAIIPHDPVLWFALMVIPTGPPALLNSGLADMSAEVTKGDKMAIAKMLAVRPSHFLSS
ncbi:uncharacterized protein BHQ10_004608 [Talaromyces amestolkiae]|uniref:Uncharacterized protein n=1 Tax=Talaromyces amestolkiae TaxID=1196081 RepID=A0A364KYF8_TALAM|nr:uncharacterized protein BHQ10_004608 [Talaromyces amestolkiae]RAO68596.1 hypothetical protein BHQ10_004608 [Talaromyces amestolkiae]